MALINEGIAITKNDDTKAAYLDRSRSLLERYRKFNKSEFLNHSEFVEWLIELKPNICPSTWTRTHANARTYPCTYTRTTAACFEPEVF